MNNIGRFFPRTIVGMGLTLLVAAFFEGGVAFIFISIICTAFISLVIWIPLWWTVGYIFLTIIGQFTKSPAKRKPPVVRESNVLTQYIRKELARGKWSLEQIDQRLRANGWSEGEIQYAHRALGIH
jgi:hypothetical protein